MPSPIITPRIRFFDADGSPLAGGFLYTYLAGTTTPLTTYTDAAGTTPNTNPVELDANGEAVVWLGDTSAYDFALKDSLLVDQPAPGLSVSSIPRIIGLSTTPSTSITYTPAGSGAVASDVQTKLRGISVSIIDYGGSPAATGATNSAALAAAGVVVAAAGGGYIDIPAGEFTFANVGAGELGGSGATSWDNRYCFRFTSNNIIIRGVGRSTILKLGSGENAHAIQFGQRAGASVSVSGCGVINCTIDGNRSGQVTPDDTLNHFSGIDVSTGCTRILLRDLYVHDAAYYGIGFQRDGHHHCSVENVEIENTGADGIDCKDDSDAGTGNTIRHLRVRSWGMLSGLSTGQAALDIRSGWVVDDVDISTPGSSAALNAIRLQNGTPGATPTQPSRVNDFRAAGTNVANSVGVRVITRYGSVTNGYVKAFADGYSLSDPDARFAYLIAEANATGFRLWQNSAASVEADTSCLIGLIARSNTSNGIVYDSVDEITVIGADVRNNTSFGHDIRTGSTNVRIIGGSATGNGTNISDSGTSTVVQHVSGVRTASVVSGSAAIDSTGVKTVTLNHNLAFTPLINEVQVSLQKSTAVTDWEAGYLWVTAVSATQITCELNVITASATGGAVVNVVASTNTKTYV